MANPFVHVELNTTDVDKAKEFYSHLFDWELEDMAMGPSGTYTIIKVGDGTGGGLLKNPEPDCPSFWLASVMNLAEVGGCRLAIGAGELGLMIVPWWAIGKKPDEKLPALLYGSPRTSGRTTNVGKLSARLPSA